MPRGMRRSAEDKLNDVNIAIQATEEQLKELKIQKKDLEKEVEHEKLKKLLEAMEESNMSPEDLINMIKK